jgi:CRP/FNR family nitrogen fixation transcriptional regulator
MRTFAEAVPTATATDAIFARPQLLESVGVRMSFARNEEIYAQEEEADFVYRVISGAVRTTRLMMDGRRQVGDFYFPGEYFGLEAGELHRFSAEALSGCVIQMIRRGHAENDPEIGRAVRAATVNELARAQEHLLLLGRKTACEKVASFLLDMAGRQSTTTVSLPMGRQDMADYLGLTIETVSRMMTQLQGSHAIALNETRQVEIRNPTDFLAFATD